MRTKPKIYGQYDSTAPRPTLNQSGEVSKTLQSHKDEADINLLVARYNKTGTFYNPLQPHDPLKTPSVPQFLDVSDLEGMENAFDVAKAVRTMFEQLPATTREMLGGTPSSFVEFAQNPANFDKCVELGIFEKPQPVGTDNILDVTVPTDTKNQNEEVKNVQA